MTKHRRVLVRILVCGGRDYSDKSTVFATLDAVSRGKPVTLIEGGATGADTLAREWRRSTGRGETITVKADWTRHGRAAGPIRNQRMIDLYKPDIVIAFPGGRGTSDMMRRAEAARVTTIRVP